MAGFNEIRYTAASTAMTVTNLHSLASSATWIAGWSSASVTNTANLNLDYLVGGTFTTSICRFVKPVTPSRVVAPRLTV